MGGPLNAHLSKLYLIDYEINNILFNKLYNPFIKAYFRYIDDIINLFWCINRQAEIMVNCLISYELHHSLKDNVFIILQITHC